VLIRGRSWRALAEEKPEAYKDIDEVARISDVAGLARRVARLVPLGVVKG
jgi:tRNA-splicing ligase RtcB